MKRKLENRSPPVQNEGLMNIITESLCPAQVLSISGMFNLEYPFTDLERRALFLDI